MRIRDLTEENVLDEGPIWDKVKGFSKESLRLHQQLVCLRLTVFRLEK